MSKQDARRKQIRHIFNGHAMPIADLAHRAIDAGIYDEGQVYGMGFRAVMAECREALKELDESGLPFAGPVSDQEDEGGPLWVQRAFWDLKHYEYNIGARTAALYADHKVIVKLREECLERYGCAPPVPTLDT